ncbi:hypothetical protein DFA_00881 [Cavenderia fasciculata]|uniref:Dolichyl-diphosphooligosaccharide--protein glycosyltransferase subunit KCP2 n=1 Tax=Cavenderia fasciculata TaxID=261658 RepID=F4PUE0_CACFS|nr:uncharacterized protein DFA_00881 [Cavenderia fasciculata]EGG21012.1 hypothetical protein DFA_00881 [Cavenderia fasciculata]|eukprot:XP_004358862.1 hypothetical protein DFA_00881 [Cavenderia fasciculata]
MAKFEHPSTGNTLAFSALSFIIVLGALQLNASFFQSTNNRTVVGGLVGSSLFFFLLTFLGAVKKELKWVEVLLSLFITFTISSSVHRVSGTTSVLFSFAILYYVNTMSKKLLKEDSTPVATTTKSKKN